MFMLVPLLLPLYLTFRLILPLPLSAAAKTVMSALLFAAALKQQFFLYFGGDFFSPELPVWVIVAYGAAFCALFMMFLFTLCKDIFLLAAAVLRCFCKAVPAFHTGPGAAAVIIALSLICTVYGVYEAQRMPREANVRIALDKLPREFDGFKIVLLSDLHISASRRADFAREVSDAANALSPDLILIAGDFIDGRVDIRSGDVLPLAALHARCGVFGVLGNHEYYFGPAEWKSFFEERLGIKILLNGHTVVSQKGADLVVAGVADEAARRFPGRELPDVKKALSGVSQDTCVILLDHQPRKAVRNAAAGVSLQLSGHTHGGMAPLISSLVKKFNGGFLRGLYDVGGMKLYVSPGTGIWNGFLVRIFDPAEITVITLTKAES
ncbi:MAG: metallophosphoesterase [Synergistes sp.]|nr:metallophosphoesterase [Synergistes sp.]